jgi:hypothetical protein
MATTIQKTTSIRSASFESAAGSQWIRMATAVAAAAASKAIVMTRTIAPLRTANEPTERHEGMPS